MTLALQNSDNSKRNVRIRKQKNFTKIYLLGYRGYRKFEYGKKKCFVPLLYFIKLRKYQFFLQKKTVLKLANVGNLVVTQT